MLVSTIAHLSSLNAVNNFAYTNIQHTQNITDKAFKGDMENYGALHRYELNTTKNLIKNTLMYRLAQQFVDKTRNLDYFA